MNAPDSMRIYKFIIRYHEPVSVGGQEYRAKLAIVLADDVATARALAKAAFSLRDLDPQWLDYVTPEEISLDEPNFIALSN